ncbi:MAG: hypothetical protein JW953_12640 [Anaerolineae bacterium]|nr:hypothetical protein [Anaerolineae bacterium]
MGRWFEEHLISLVFGFIGAVFAVIGGGFLWGYFHTQQETQQAAQIPLYTLAQLGDISSGTPVAIEGRISEQNTPRFEGLVAYIARQYQGIECDDEDDEDDDGDYECDEVWSLVERVTPALWLDLPEGRVRVGNTDYDLLNAPEVWQTTLNPIEYETLEYQGFRMGNPVFVIGQVKTNDGVSLNADFLSGGNRQDYFNSQAEAATVLLVMGFVFAGFGLVFLLVAIVTAGFASPVKTKPQ